MDFELDSHGFCWVLRRDLPSWAGYLDRSGAYGGEGGIQPSTGAVDIVFAHEGRDDSAMTDHERSLVQWFFDHEPGVSDAVKAAIFQNYARLQREYDYSAAERAE